MMVREIDRPTPMPSGLASSSPQLELANANPLTVVAFMLLGSFSFVGIGMIAAILPLLYVERGAQIRAKITSAARRRELGEDAVEWWHDEESGFAGRSPIDWDGA